MEDTEKGERNFTAVLLSREGILGFPGGSVVKNPPANAGGRGLTLGQKEPLEQEVAGLSSNLALKSHGHRTLAGYSPGGCKRVRHN